MKTNANRWKRAGALWAVLVILAGTGAACSRTGEPVTASGTEVTERTQPPTQPSAAAAPAEPDWRLLLVNARNPLPEGFTVQTVLVEEDVCYVNLSSSMLEELQEGTVLRPAIRALARSLLSLESVEAVRFLVNGEAVDSIGGVDVSQVIEN